MRDHPNHPNADQNGDDRDDNQGEHRKHQDAVCALRQFRRIHGTDQLPPGSLGIERSKNGVTTCILGPKATRRAAAFPQIKFTSFPLIAIDGGTNHNIILCQHLKLGVFPQVNFFQITV
ncbi:hypothetical protein D3C81_1086760 [compost metagenome]